LTFNSIAFLVFFPLVATAFFLIPHRWRWFLLLGASYLFYTSWNPKYLVVLLTMTTIGYLTGRLLERQASANARRLLLVLSLSASLGILFFFKYFELSSRVLQAAFDQFGMGDLLPGIQLLLPLGISYFTFQTMSYILDVYRGVTKAEHHAGIYALFISFFPHLTAGPIARANQLLPQFRAIHSPDYEMVVSGLQRMAWGFFKKLVIADRLALLVNTVYGDPTSFTGTALILATYAFAFQVYCDFSAYADIAIGAARVMGFKLEENFQQPYYAQSIPDFWRRWHITLYNWLSANADDACQRTLAWHELDLSCLGRVARCLHGSLSFMEPLRDFSAFAVHRTSASSERDQDLYHFQSGLFCMDILPRRVDCRCFLYHPASICEPGCQCIPVRADACGRV
jgi:alginate O-acetyltransferase complex protein AlgI